MTTTPSPALPAAPATPPPASRKRALLGVSLVVLLAAGAYAIWWTGFAKNQESTDNAYVQAPILAVTPQVAGTVTQVLADDTDEVRAGQLLVRLDAADARVAVERAEAQLAQVVRETQTLYSLDASLAAQVSTRQAELARAQAEVQKATDDVQRRAPLAASGAISQEEARHAEAALTAARSALAAAQSARLVAEENAAANLALTARTSTTQHPQVARAASAVREAWLGLRRTEIRAPVAGQVARRGVQPGQRVAPGTPLMSVVALNQAWVDANFKEAQLRQMRVGQDVRLHADLYGAAVEFKGRVVGLGAGTGASFALLPAQNATGNWIKVVQRVPVRIALDPAELKSHPLRVGLSMEVTVDTRQRLSGQGPPADPVTAVTASQAASVPAATPATTRGWQAASLEEAAADPAVEQRILSIVQRNLTPAPTRARPASGPTAARDSR